jgi:MSHA biogenesis protein MshQ
MSILATNLLVSVLAPPDMKSRYLVAIARLGAVLAFVLAPGAAAIAATCTGAAGAVNWNTAASWSCGHVPAAGDAVIVPNGSTVTLNVDTNALASLQVDLGGTITLAAGASFDIYLGGNLVNNGSLNLQSSTGTNTIYLTGNTLTSTFSGSGTWLLDNLDLNGKNPKSCTGACKVELSGSPNLQFYNGNLFSALSASNTFNALGNSTATVTLNRPGNQTMAVANVTYPNLVLAGSGTKSVSGGTMTVLGDLTISNGTTYNGSGNPAVNLAGDFTNSGTFTSGSGTFTFNGTSAQTLTGSTTFTRLALSNAAGLTMASGDVTVTTLLTLSSGAITTNSNTLITTQNCNTPSVTRTSGFVVGNLQKKIPGGASTCAFEIGSGSSFAPVVAVFPAGTGGATSPPARPARSIPRSGPPTSIRPMT